jgi:hypothetical protein
MFQNPLVKSDMALLLLVVRRLGSDTVVVGEGQLGGRGEITVLVADEGPPEYADEGQETDDRHCAAGMVEECGDIHDLVLPDNVGFSSWP